MKNTIRGSRDELVPALAHLPGRSPRAAALIGVGVERAGPSRWPSSSAPTCAASAPTWSGSTRGRWSSTRPRATPRMAASLRKHLGDRCEEVRVQSHDGASASVLAFFRVSLDARPRRFPAARQGSPGVCPSTTPASSPPCQTMLSSWNCAIARSSRRSSHDLGESTRSRMGPCAATGVWRQRRASRRRGGVQLAARPHATGCGREITAYASDPLPRARRARAQRRAARRRRRFARRRPAGRRSARRGPLPGRTDGCRTACSASRASTARWSCRAASSTTPSGSSARASRASPSAA